MRDSGLTYFNSMSGLTAKDLWMGVHLPVYKLTKGLDHDVLDVGGSEKLSSALLMGKIEVGPPFVV